MANARQKRKRRSTTRRVVVSKTAKKRMKKMPTIQGPQVLRDGWDKRKTLRQNYQALGLVETLTPRSTIARAGQTEVEPERQEMGRIVRDENGEVVRVELEDGGEMEEEESALVEDRVKVPEEMEMWAGFAPGASNTSVIQELERVSGRGEGRRRRVSEMTRRYMERLVDKYGTDVEGMVRDVRLNYEQRTMGELRRGLGSVNLGVDLG